MKKIKEGSSSPREVKKELIEVDFFSLITELKTHSSTSPAAEIVESFRNFYFYFGPCGVK